MPEFPLSIERWVTSRDPRTVGIAVLVIKLKPAGRSVDLTNMRKRQIGGSRVDQLHT